MDDFSTPGNKNSYGFPSSPSNYIFPGKIPQSSMSPSIIFNEQNVVVLMAGASGGSRIISATAQVRHEPKKANGRIVPSVYFPRLS
jgi:gamma-glutamyltranspeptidase/glutathione hydrolase/leukotriene-C4 hydrolase